MKLLYFFRTLRYRIKQIFLQHSREVIVNIEKKFQEQFNYIFSQVGTENWARYVRFFMSAFKLRLLGKKELYIQNAMKLYCEFVSPFQDSEREKGINVIVKIKKIIESFLVLSDEEGESIEKMIRQMLPKEQEIIRDYFRKKLNGKIFDLYNDSKLYLSDEERIYEALKETENIDCFDEFMIVKEGLDIETIFATFKEYFILEPDRPFNGCKIDEYNMMSVYRGEEHLLIVVTTGVTETYVSIRII